MGERRRDLSELHEIRYTNTSAKARDKEHERNLRYPLGCGPTSGGKFPTKWLQGIAGLEVYAWDSSHRLAVVDFVWPSNAVQGAKTIDRVSNRLVEGLDQVSLSTIM